MWPPRVETDIVTMNDDNDTDRIFNTQHSDDHNILQNNHASKAVASNQICIYIRFLVYVGFSLEYIFCGYGKNSFCWAHCCYISITIECLWSESNGSITNIDYAKKHTHTQKVMISKAFDNKSINLCLEQENISCSLDPAINIFFFFRIRNALTYSSYYYSFLFSTVIHMPCWKFSY